MTNANTGKIAALAGVLTLAMAGGASAHVSLERGEAPTGAGYKAVFSVPHGCKGQATNEVIIDIPEGVIAVKPMPKAGWKLSLEKGPYARSYGFYHGDTKSEGVKRVTWSGGELADEHFDQFVLSSFIAAELPADGTLVFPVTQKCADGELRWEQVAAPGQDPHSLEYPAPVLRLVAGGGHDHHHHNHGAAAASSDVTVTQAWTRPVAAAGGMGVGYGKITNAGKETDAVIGASSDAAERVELHETTINDAGVASMKKVDRLEVGGGNSIELKPGGLHLMLIGMKQPVKDGDTVKVKLKFEHAGDVEVALKAQKTAPDGKTDAHDHSHDHHDHGDHKH
ncbi:Conserved membrane protein in copper uptake, YcnI [Hyphomicrobium sulfonivorans]|uniref:Conserved membrane protein in copper uptake, YcnI n=1 Tax=Hyphomicrobium sulfonivorans TaxID=121290 RepID=A0A109BAX8_HYPSL|nr:DUF1775 domain-containing protein [Hyphomicrobium sulfonivorans]KWT65401.1 Conserved membrane protein in copper uptake, YcnI [Hyphomicrobium sulfonivorans]